MDTSYAEDNRKRFSTEGISVSTKLVAATEAEICRNNRLSLLMETHEKRQKLGATDVKQTEIEVEEMSKNFKATCEVCTQKNALVKFVHGVNMCSTCQSIYAHVGNRLPQVAAAVRQLDKLSELLMELGVEQVAVQVESSALKRIGELVGYAEGSEEGLIERVAHLANQVFAADKFLTNIVGLLEYDLDCGDFTYESVINAVRKKCELEHAAAMAMMVSGDMVKALFGEERMISRDQCDIAAIQVAAQYEDVKRSHLHLYHLLANICGLLQLDENATSDAIIREIKNTIEINSWLNARVKELGDRAESRSEILTEIMAEIAANSLYTDRPESFDQLPQIVANIACDHKRLHHVVDRIKNEKNILAEQVAESEQRALAAEQIFARLREMLQADSLSNAELPNAVAMLMDKKSEPMEYTQDSIGSSFECGPQRDGLDSHLLDLLVDFPAIGVERIAVIREAV